MMGTYGFGFGIWPSIINLFFIGVVVYFAVRLALKEK